MFPSDKLTPVDFDSVEVKINSYSLSLQIQMNMQPNVADTASTLPINLRSKLPTVGMTIFNTMSALVIEKNAVNLGQGFPDFNYDPALTDAVSNAMKNGLNQYPPMVGVPSLRNVIATKIKKLYGYIYNPVNEINITAGITQGLLTAIMCAVHLGDEVIVIEPAYESYVPAIELAGGKSVFVQMTLGANGYNVPWDKIAAVVSPRTRLIIIKSPHIHRKHAERCGISWYRTRHGYPHPIG